MTKSESKLLTEAVVNNYRLGYTVEQLADKHSISVGSVIRRLTHARAYASKGYTSKYGKMPMTKEEYVSILEVHTGLDLSGLEKATKPVVEKLYSWAIKQGENDGTRMGI